ncbi:SpvB/TcaC N-terminal domain-containing protein [Burkholderia orbicola]|uniref:SpvB/TcaC N-terminal domain-containing protein n=1 Tax=Burkholderia orbicola TaxID=2978683 RepID=UPI002FDF5BF5
MQKDTSVAVQSLALPKGGGALVGLGDSLSPIGPSGMAGLSLPLPVSAGRGYAPALALAYSSGAGNGPFGLGWQLGLPTIQRRTNRGVPRYDGGPEDEFVGPDGEVLVSERDDDGKTITASVSTYGTKTLSTTYQVTRYLPRVEGAFDRIERWQSADPIDDFWLIHGADGQLHCLGKTAAARIAHPDHPEQIAQWRIEESVNPSGEHIYYRYVAENADNVIAGNESNRDHAANRYLAEVFYGNQTAAADLYLWDSADASAQGWLFSLVLDYGERGVAFDTAPAYAAPGGSTWALRADSFSRYEYGFEVRTHRLCRQVLMFHHFPRELKQDHTLVRRLLLTYQESAVLSQLTQARSLAYEADGTVQSLPPLELGYSAFEPAALADSYRVFDGVAELNDLTHYQMVDLYGDGLPGVLFRHGTGWRYRPPVRGKQGTDEVAYGDWQALPAVPSMQPARLTLMDIDGDGRLDWLVTQPGMSGCFALKEGNQWSGFTPFTALPPEFFHPQAQLADLVGAGLSDLALIGPKSVRLYANRRDGYAKATEVAHDGDESGLPMAGRDARELVAFSDVLGSGQSHLVRIRHDGLTCWPNLGRGRFGQPFQLATLDFDRATFNPDQIFLADLDGSGAADLIYLERDHLTLYLNQSGNGFAAPVTLPLPQGLTFDRLCRVSIADLQGIGVASLVISHPHMAPSHRRLDFAHAKPYLMASVNNNMGASTTFAYRSSAQFWLDDKLAHPELTSALPMPIHTVAQVVTRDEITGNSVTQQYGYHHGVYDGVEREFRGFALVSAQDAQQVSTTVASDVPLAPPLLTRTWYHTGREADETRLFGPPYADADALTLKATRLTRYDTSQNQDVELDTKDDATTRRWLFRALKGVPLRQEVYGLDGSDKQAIPYTVSASRYQVRLVQAGAGHASPVALPGALEQVSYHYERIAVDPMVSQQIQLQRDRYGAVTWQVGVNYPRRPKPQTNPYPDSLPATSWASSYDDQQTSLILTEQRSEPIHLDAHQAWRLGLPCLQRGNVLIYDAGQVPSGGLSFEAMSQSGGLLDADQARTYAGQQRIVYTDTPVALTALVDHVETAEFDDPALKAFEGVLDQKARDALLVQAGYQLGDRVLSPGEAAEPQVWVARRGYTTYRPAAGFLRPSSQRTSLLTGKLTYEYDDHTCVLTKTTDALGNETTAEYDYRFLQPWRILDLNANTHEVLLDALGRVVAGSFYGTEEGQAVGFAAVEQFSPRGLTLVQAIDNAGKTPQQVASIQLVDAFSWMGQITQAALKDLTDDVPGLWHALEQHGFITADGMILATGHAWANGDTSLPDAPNGVRAVIQGTVRQPVHSVTLVADRYPSDPAQQVRVGVGYVDGLGRALQAVQKVPAGLAWQRETTGEIVVDEDGKPVDAEATTRWAVSGKVEYDNKGQPVRSYQPYFIDDWRYVADTAMRTCGYADTHFYDATGREVQVVTAKGYLRRTGYFPWFTVAEDENDTWQPTA